MASTLKRGDIMPGIPSHVIILVRGPAAPCSVSHMGKRGEKEIVVPSCLKHFVADAKRAWRCLQDIDGQLADDGEVFRGAILAAAAGILVEQNVENPVQVVLDAPMRPHDLEQLLGRQQARGQKVPDLVLGSVAVVGAPTVDAADGSDSGEAVLLGQLRCRRDDGLPTLDAVVSGGPSLARPLWLSGGIEQRLDSLEEPAAIALDGQHVVAPPVADGLRRVGPAMQASAVTRVPSRSSRARTSRAPATSLRLGAFL